MSREILVSWIGNADIVQAVSDEELGPLESILKFKSFDILYVLSNNPEVIRPSYISMLTDKYHITINSVLAQLRDPTHYGDIYQNMDMLLKKITRENTNGQITLQITSGTPAMTAVSILLGKAKYSTNFIQSTREQGVVVPDLPFDVAADFHPSNDQNNKLSSFFTGEAPDTAAFSDIITQSPQIETLKQKAAIIAKRDVPVLITGETGTGKELFAKAIHNTSSRANKPLLVLNCGAIPKDLIDTTLFGHEKGAFTGANTAKEGYFSRAHGGTLFLDELGELPLDSQVSLLRVIAY
jgi:transcriptional regulator with PAS, ATPase and Fis domain